MNDPRRAPRVYFHVDEPPEHPLPAGNTLPALTGTPAEVDRATEIRRKLTAALMLAMGVYCGPATAECVLATVRRAPTSAAWWIERAEVRPAALAREISDAVPGLAHELRTIVSTRRNPLN